MKSIQETRSTDRGKYYIISAKTFVTVEGTRLLVH